MKFEVIGFTVGVLLVVLGAASLIPALVDYVDGHNNAFIFVENILICLFFGGALMISNRNFEHRLNVRQVFFLSVFGWIFMAVFAAIPLALSDLGLSASDAFFEAMSGITTTGASVISDVESASRGILLWRSMLQWIGGMGMLAFGIIILPYLQIGGMQIYHQYKGAGGQVLGIPRAQSLLFSLIQIYFLLSFLFMIGYVAIGMNGFEAVNHAMTTISTGGFSIYNNGFMHYKSGGILFMAAIFMIISALPFTLYIRAVYQRKFFFSKNEQLQYFLWIIALFLVVFSLYAMFGGAAADIEFMDVFFNVISILTTTGYASADFAVWGPFAVMMFFFMAYIGGCAGSAAGGLKIMRIVVLFRSLRRQLKTLIFPHGVFSMYFQGHKMKSSDVMTVMGFLGFYTLCNVVLTIGLCGTGVDLYTSVSAAASAIANIGPGVNEIIGPAGDYSALPTSAKWMLSAGMLIGRLEILTVVVLFSGLFWRK